MLSHLCFYLLHFPQSFKWHVYKICNWNLVLHLPQQQEALCFLEARNSKWAENKWRDSNSRLTASWIALWINYLLFTPGMEVFMQSEEKLKSRWLDGSAWFQRIYTSGGRFFSRGQGLKQKSTNVSSMIQRELSTTGRNGKESVSGVHSHVLSSLGNGKE